jgi:hypothetical protein
MRCTAVQACPAGLGIAAGLHSRRDSPITRDAPSPTHPDTPTARAVCLPLVQGVMGMGPMVMNPMMMPGMQVGWACVARVRV